MYHLDAEIVLVFEDQHHCFGIYLVGQKWFLGLRENQ
jgi:hypothetical protein